MVAQRIEHLIEQAMQQGEKSEQLFKLFIERNDRLVEAVDELTRKINDLMQLNLHLSQKILDTQRAIATLNIEGMDELLPPPKLGARPASTAAEVKL